MTAPNQPNFSAVMSATRGDTNVQHYQRRKAIWSECMKDGTHNFSHILGGRLGMSNRGQGSLTIDSSHKQIHMAAICSQGKHVEADIQEA